MEILIKNAQIVNAESIIQSDIYCKDGKIFKIEEGIEPMNSTDRVIDASGKLMFPGGIDPHVHMHLPTPAGFSADDFESGSKAALIGGTTTLIDFVTPHKGQKLAEAIAQRKEEARNAVCDYTFHVSPIEWREGLHKELVDVIQKEGLKSFKVYMAYKDSIGLGDDILFKVMQSIGQAGGVLLVHCELGDKIDELRDQLFRESKTSPFYHPLSRPAEWEAQAVKKAIDFADEANCTLYIVHVSSKESLTYIQEAQSRGQKVYAESCPQYLLLEDSVYDGDFENTAAYVLSPPLRKKEDQQALWQAINEKTVLTIGTDHCPFTFAQKSRGIDDFRKIPNGAGGVEHRMALIYNYGVLEGKISLKQLVELTSTNAAKIFGLYPKKGKIAVGADADMVIWNPDSEEVISAKTHHQNNDQSIYEGMRIRGSVEVVIKDGRVVLENNKLSSHLKQGQLLKTKG